LSKKIQDKFMMLKYLIISFLIVLSLQGLSQDTCLYYQRYIDKGDSIFKKLRTDTKFEKLVKKDETKFADAINAYNTAMLHCPAKAQEARSKILEVFKYIEKVKKEAIDKRNLANFLYRVADTAKAAAIAQKKIADTAKENAYKSNLSNAPYKYIRLVKDGPKDKDKIKRDSFDYKLIAYCNHLVSVKDSMNTKKMNTAIDTLNSLVENLYFNNDLYEKIYFCLDANGWKSSVLDSSFKISGASLFAEKIKIKSLAEKRILPPGKKFTSAVLSKNQHLLFCATEDNYIVVYNDKSFHAIDTIALGTKITALDYDDNSSTIFFGTVKGDIGFIRYNIDSKNQPVYDFENSLGSQTTAIEFFKYKDLSFLLATGINSKATVFELDSNYLVSNNKISGNILPDKEIGSINDAKFDATTHMVMLQTTSKSGIQMMYSWNPFTYEILEKFKKLLNFNPPDISAEKEKNIWTESKFY